MRYYKKYLADRLTKERQCASVLEKDAASIAHRFSPKGNFRMLTFIGGECYDCICTTDNQQHLMIRSMSCTDHDLVKLFGQDGIPRDMVEKLELAFFERDGEITYDDYYNQKYKDLADYHEQLGYALDKIPTSALTDVYVTGDFVDLKAVRYAIQEKNGKAVYVRASTEPGTESKIFFSQELLSQKIHTSIPAITLLDVIRQRGIDIFIPDDAASLGSVFMCDITWQEIIPEDCAKCMVGQSECFYVRLNFETDIFNNLFCSTEDASGHTKKILVCSPFHKVDISEELNGIAMAMSV